MIPDRLPALDVDHPVWVKFSGQSKWEKRHFAKWDNGTMYVWIDGRTSFTTGGIIAIKEWSLTDPKKVTNG